MNDNLKMAELLLADITAEPEEFESRYPARDLPEGAVVTRFSPSPTGFLHIGGLYAAYICTQAAKKSGGVSYLRIEDTDKKREVENGVTAIVEGLNAFGITFDEGMTSETTERGEYGPYIQSKRTPIYQAYAKSLIKRGLAYPCFCTAEELDEIRARQEAEKLTPGYYGEFAKYRNIDYETAERLISEGHEYVVRLKSPGSTEGRIRVKDGVKGTIEMPENIQDIVLLKKDGTPTYHFAHAIDDHLMRTTDVIRGDEWLSSLPIHIQLFNVLGFKPPKYSHISPIMKEEDGKKRKISKRKDPEAAVSYYAVMGYPKESVLEYLMTLANSNFEDWRIANPTADLEEFAFSLKKLGKAGALFDLVKLNDISKSCIAKMSADTVYEKLTEWAAVYDKEYYDIITADPEYTHAVLSIERGNAKPRKDIAKWDEVRDYTAYMFNSVWSGKRDFADNLTNADMVEILSEYKKVYNHSGTAEEWFPVVREMAVALGYAKTPKLYKKEPENYRGHVGDVSGVIRAAVTGRRNTPDLYSIMQVLGEDEVIKRINEAIEILGEN